MAWKLNPFTGKFDFYSAASELDHGDLTGLTGDDHTQYLLAAGTRVLTGDWDIGNGRKISGEQIQARDGDGLKLFEDGGTGIFVKDGGNVSVGYADPGTAKLAIDGNVGIGTTAPTALNGVSPVLHLNGTAGTELHLQTTSNTGAPIISWDSKTSGGVVQQYYAGMGILLGNGAWELYDKTANANRLTVSISGNVGIGTVIPTSILHTVASGAKTAAYSGNLLTNTATSSTVSIRKAGVQITSTGTWNGTSADNVGLYVSSVTGGTNNYDAIFNGGGNVGIGTTDPGFPLDVQAATGVIQAKSTTGTNYAFINALNTGGQTYIGKESSVGGAILAGTSAYAGVLATTGEYPLQFGVNNSIEMTILTSGNVGIGTTVPRVKLDTAGVIRSIANDAGWASFGTGLEFSYDLTDDAGEIIAYDRTGGAYKPLQLFGSKISLMQGNVGIGTTDPLTYKLYVAGTQYVEGTASFAGAINVGTSADIGTLLYMRSNIRLLNKAEDNWVTFATRDVSGSEAVYNLTNIGTLTTSGNVGIGIEPIVKLQVSGTVSFDGNVGIGTTAPQVVLHVVGNSILGTNDSVSGTAGTVNIVSSDTTVKPFLTVHASNALDYGFDFDSEQTSVGRMDLYGVIAGARTQIMSWQRTGNVGIGTTAPVNKLQVSGNVYVHGNLDIVVPTADHTTSGVRLPFTAGNNLNFGDACRIANTGKAVLAKADVIANASALFMCAEESIATDVSGKFLATGTSRDDTWNWSVGGLIYLSPSGTTGNTLTQIRPSGTDEVVQILGVATHADRMYFSPGLVQVEHT